MGGVECARIPAAPFRSYPGWYPFTRDEGSGLRQGGGLVRRAGPGPLNEVRAAALVAVSTLTAVIVVMTVW